MADRSYDPGDFKLAHPTDDPKQLERALKSLKNIADTLTLDEILDSAQYMARLRHKRLEANR